MYFLEYNIIISSKAHTNIVHDLKHTSIYIEQYEMKNGNNKLYTNYKKYTFLKNLKSPAMDKTRLQY